MNSITTEEPPPADALLVVDDLVFGYRGAPLLFEGWSHRFAPGLAWVRGDNGCGKSTLLRLLGGVLDPHAGVVRQGARDVRRDALAYRREVYWCGPDGTAFDHLRPPEFFGFVAGLYPRFDAAEAARWVDTFGLDGLLTRPIATLSTGTRRKVAVIAAISSGATVVLLDEPLAGLDQASLTVMRAAFSRAADRRDRLWIVASHEPLGGAAVRGTLLDLPPRDA